MVYETIYISNKTTIMSRGINVIREVHRNGRAIRRWRKCFYESWTGRNNNNGIEVIWDIVIFKLVVVFFFFSFVDFLVGIYKWTFSAKFHLSLVWDVVIFDHKWSRECIIERKKKINNSEWINEKTKTIHWIIFNIRRLLRVALRVQVHLIIQDLKSKSKRWALVALYTVKFKCIWND